MARNYREQMRTLGLEARRGWQERLASPDERLHALFDIVAKHVKSLKHKEQLRLATRFDVGFSSLKFHGVRSVQSGAGRDEVSLGVEQRGILDVSPLHERMVLIGVNGDVRVAHDHIERINQQFIIEPKDGKMVVHRSTSYDERWMAVDGRDLEKHTKFMEALVDAAMPRHGGPDTG